MANRWHTDYEAGDVGGITVAVVFPESAPQEFYVKLLGTYEGISDVGDAFIGPMAKANAAVFAEKVFSAIEISEMTWLGKGREA